MDSSDAMAISSDGELVRAAKAGSLIAFDELVVRYQGSIVRLAQRLTEDVDDGRDIAQEAFLRAYVHLASCEPDERFASWLRAITRNAAFDVLRRRKRRQSGSAPKFERSVNDGQNPEELLLRRVCAERVRSVLATLPPRYRDVLDMYYVNNLSYREIASSLAIPIGTVKTLLCRGKRLARNDLRELVA